MNQKNPYSFNSTYGSDYLDDNQDVKTNQNIEALNKLLDEANYGDDTFEEFTLDSQANNNTLNFDKKNSFKDEPSDFSQSDDDPLEKTMEIKDVSLPEMKALQAQLHEIYEEKNEEATKDEATNSGQSKGRSLVKATKQGIAFSNGSMTRTFLDCAVLCFITASMGYGMFMYIMTHI